MNDKNLNRENKPEPVYKNRNLQIIYGVTLMVVMGVSSIAPAFPKIAESLEISEEEVGLLIIVFTFPGIILTTLLGIAADRFGRKRVLVPSLFLFGIAGGACAFTRDFNTLLVFRFFQGIGAASLGALNTTVIGDIFSGSRQRLSEAMGYNAGVLSIGTAGYPALGGLLATFGWHYPFLLPVAAIPIGLIVLFRLKNPEPANKQGIKEYIQNTWKCFQNKEVAGLFIISLV
ncbi:MAG: MFS transporter, partial [bacterium]|nr:MFS transporter [bacterium]